MLNIKELKSNARNIILNYLDTIVSNPSLSYLNHMLLFIQGRRGEVVCGRGAWEAMGRTIKAEATMLHILYPAIVITDEGVPFRENDKDVLDIETNILFMMKQTKFDIRYLVMGVYAYLDTEGKDIEEKTNKINFFDRIAVITEITPEIVEKPFPLFEQGEYDPETNQFFLSKNCPSEKEKEALLSMFIDYLMHEKKMLVLFHRTYQL